jgi:hypothetical protein
MMVPKYRPFGWFSFPPHWRISNMPTFLGQQIARGIAQDTAEEAREAQDTAEKARGIAQDTAEKARHADEDATRKRERDAEDARRLAEDARRLKRRSGEDLDREWERTPKPEPSDSYSNQEIAENVAISAELVAWVYGDEAPDGGDLAAAAAAGDYYGFEFVTPKRCTPGSLEQLQKAVDQAYTMAREEPQAWNNGRELYVTLDLVIDGKAKKVEVSLGHPMFRRCCDASICIEAAFGPKMSFWVR